VRGPGRALRRLRSELHERLRALLFGAREDAELEEELAFHFEREVAANRERGMSGEDAVRAARLKLGSTDRFTEETRDARGVRALTDFGQDLRLAVREMRRRPGFALVAVLTLAIGMAGVTAVFSIRNHMLLRPLPAVQEQDRLVTVRFQEDEWNDTGLSYLNFHELAPSLASFDAFVGFVTSFLQMLPEDGRATMVDGVTAVGDYFGALGVAPAHGRFFAPAELGPISPGVVVISHRLWRERYGGRDLAGATLRVNGRTYDIIGVAPRGFRGTDRLEHTDVWLPPAAYSELRHFASQMTENRRADAYRRFFGRLAPGVTIEQAEQELTLAIDRLRMQYPEVAEQYERNRPRVYAGVGMPPQRIAGVRRTVRLMFVVAAVVLLIACANVANLLLFRALRSRGESAVRRALGASTLRILQHHTAQGLMLAGLGAAAGLGLAVVLLRSADNLALVGASSLAGVAVDMRVLVFSIALALATAVLFAAVPTLFSRKWDLVTNLREAARSETGRTAWVRSGLVVLQLAMSAALVVPAILLVSSVRNLNDVELGFDPDGVHAFGLTVDPQGYDIEQRTMLQTQLLERLRAEPSFAGAATTTTTPFWMARFLARISGPQQEGGDPVLVSNPFISDGYFDLLRIGRPDAASASAATAESALRDAPVDAVVVSRSAAELLFGSTDVVGRTFTEHGFTGDEVRRVVGVVEDVRHAQLREAPAPVVYRPAAHARQGGFMLLVRSRVTPAQTEAIVGDVLASLDPALPFFRAEPLRAEIDAAMMEELLFARLTVVLGMLAALLAAVGLYGLMAYSVAQRRREIGIRMALGARAARVVLLVTRDTTRLTLIGLALGCIGAWAIARLLQTMLFGVQPLEPVSYLVAAAFFLVIGLAAAALPARSAAGVQPAVTLRTD
jgi:putative ABC transport system permease protein